MRGKGYRFCPGTVLMQAGQTHLLSDHPIIQNLLTQIQQNEGA
jgi:hypothetical protein